MSLLDKLKGPDINEKVREAREDPSITLIDVRMPDEYRAGHIPGAINVPLPSIGDIEKIVAGKDARIYVSCQSGKRSQRAVNALQQLGYANVENVGGIVDWNGPIE